jgi:hypothetical protein
MVRAAPVVAAAEPLGKQADWPRAGALLVTGKAEQASVSARLLIFGEVRAA